VQYRGGKKKRPLRSSQCKHRVKPFQRAEGEGAAAVLLKESGKDWRTESTAKDLNRPTIKKTPHPKQRQNSRARFKRGKKYQKIRLQAPLAKEKEKGRKGRGGEKKDRQEPDSIYRGG